MLRKLPAADARRVAALQVLSEVVAAVKELLENSLDAGAKRVEVELEAGGVDLLRITDDGGGIPAESLPLLGQPHHTSKIDSLDALSRLASYGFRGEALHAIVESSTAVVVKSALPNGPCMQHTLGSQDQPAAASTPIRWTHGELVKSGTCVEVRGLFAKYPVRRKSAQSEDFMKKLLFLLTSYGIARPAVHLAAYFRRPASACFIKAPQPDVATTILAQFGPDAAACVELVPSRALPFGLTLSCLLPVPHRAAESLRSRPDRSFYYVNTRPVDMPVLAKLLNKRLRAYTAATSRTHAMCVVLITSPPNLIDVNLSPDKRKLYFQGHVAKALEAKWTDLLKERYPLPLADDAIEVDSGTEEPDGGDAGEERAKRRLSELGDLPSTQPTLATPLPQPFDASAFAVTLVQDPTNAPPSSASAPAPVSPALAAALRAPVAKPSAPKPKAAPRPIAQPAAAASASASASEALGEEGGAAAAPPTKRKRSENEVEEEAVPIPWTVPAIRASVNALADTAASPALTLADARSALVLCAPSGGSTLVRAGSGVYSVDTARLLAATQSDLGTPVAVMLAKLTALEDDRNQPLLQAPHWRPGTPALPHV